MCSHCWKLHLRNLLELLIRAYQWSQLYYGCGTVCFVFKRLRCWAEFILDVVLERKLSAEQNQDHRQYFLLGSCDVVLSLQNLENEIDVPWYTNQNPTLFDSMYCDCCVLANQTASTWSLKYVSLVIKLNQIQQSRTQVQYTCLHLYYTKK